MVQRVSELREDQDAAGLLQDNSAGKNFISYQPGQDGDSPPLEIMQIQLVVENLIGCKRDGQVCGPAQGV